MSDTFVDISVFFGVTSVILLGGFAILDAQLKHAKSKMKLVPVKIRTRGSGGSPLP